MTETYVRFRGTNASVDKLDIGLGDRVEFTASGECVAIGTEKRADGEERPVVTVKVDEVELGDVTEGSRDEQLPFDDSPDAEL
ncbi:hypothetical protein [Pseudonocardia broussonetiae]|uniref:Uncharacterized protein n=1 Tax=Pseudonocardia broussonetiae TaxID=2736640 RepID=A0A6M6JJ70_9PSEU|nr:hypothetical protein [Pseudonocardia broussonetiae]QJY46682.1 hypothetical protein HOP40_13335 [Pseudonocardia broussonetiae]